MSERASLALSRKVTRMTRKMAELLGRQHANIPCRKPRLSVGPSADSVVTELSTFPWSLKKTFKQTGCISQTSAMGPSYEKFR